MASGTTPGRLAAIFHDAAAPHASEAEIAWYRAQLPRDAGTLLAVMSGSGRLMLPLLEAGFSLHAVDASDAMLATCATRCARAGFDVQLFRQEVAMLNLPFRYAAAFIFAGSFQLLARSHACDALASLRAHLVEPAVLLLDLFVPEAALHPPGAPVVEVDRVALADASVVVRRSETLVDSNRKQVSTSSRYEHRVAGRITGREDGAEALTWYSDEEIAAMLRDAGYHDIRTDTVTWPGPAGERFAVSARG